jgi:Ca-activated chloride channel family protein
MTWKPGLAAALQLVAASHLFAQAVEIKPISTRRGAVPLVTAPMIRADADLVLVPVHVTNRAGASLTGLNAGAFTVLENKLARDIVSFGNEDTPCSLGIVLDLSGSMANRLRAASSALHAFLDTANPQDEAFLLTVSTRPQAVSGFTDDFGFLQSRLLGTGSGGATALIDTIYMALDRMSGAAHRGHKAILVISDGMDNHSRYTASELLRRVEEEDVQIYTIGVQTWALTKKPMELTEERDGQAFLQTLADRTGGLKRTIRDFNEAPPVAAELSRAIRDQYLIGYRPAGRDDSGKWRAIQVRVNIPYARVSARTGYYSR